MFYCPQTKIWNFKISNPVMNIKYVSIKQLLNYNQLGWYNNEIYNILNDYHRYTMWFNNDKFN